MKILLFILMVILSFSVSVLANEPLVDSTDKEKPELKTKPKVTRTKKSKKVKLRSQSESETKKQNPLSEEDAPPAPPLF